MALFGNTEKAKERQLSKILGYTGSSDMKTLNELENEFENQIVTQQADPPMGSPLGDATVPVTNQVNQATPQAVSLETQPQTPASLISMEEQQANNQSLFGDLAMRQEVQNIDPFDAVLGDKPTIDEDRLKRAKTQDLINAFGDILRGGVGLAMLQGGNVVTGDLLTPQSNKGVSAIKGVYDDYYKELAEYRDKESRVALAKIQDQSRKEEIQTQREIDEEKAQARMTFDEAQNKANNDTRIKIAEMNNTLSKSLQGAKDRNTVISVLEKTIGNILEGNRISVSNIEDLNRKINEGTELSEEENAILQTSIQDLQQSANQRALYQSILNKYIQTGQLDFSLLDGGNENTNNDNVNPVVTNPVDTTSSTVVTPPAQTTNTQEQAIQQAKDRVSELFSSLYKEAPSGDLGVSIDFPDGFEVDNIVEVRKMLNILNNMGNDIQKQSEYFGTNMGSGNQKGFKKIREIRDLLQSIVEKSTPSNVIGG